MYPNLISKSLASKSLAWIWGKAKSIWRSLRYYLIFCALMFGIAIGLLYSGVHLAMPYALVVLLAGISADFYTTEMCFKAGGREGNPVAAFFFKRFGKLGAYGLTLVIWVGFILWRWLPSSETSQTIVAIVYWMVPANNLITTRRLINRKNRINMMSKKQEGLNVQS